MWLTSQLLIYKPRETREVRTKINTAAEHHESIHYIKTYTERRLSSLKYLLSLNSAAASVRNALARTMPSLFPQLFGSNSILTSITITATTSHGGNYKRKMLGRAEQVREAMVSAQGNLSAKPEGGTC